MTHMNIAELSRVSRRIFLKIFHVSLRRHSATTNAANAPNAELSTRLVNPKKNEPMTENIRRSGIMPALKTLSFSFMVKLRSLFGRMGPILGFILHLMRI